MKSIDSTFSLLRYFQEKQIALKLPSHVTMELTPLCNFHCPMCYVRKDQIVAQEHPLNVEQWLLLLQRAKDAGILHLSMTGGEILTYSGFRTIYETAYDMGFYITLMTNGYLLDDETAVWLANRKPLYVKLTLYGASNETYQRVCRVPDGFDRVTAAIMRLKTAGISVRTCMTLIQENKDDLDAVGQWTKSHELPFVYSQNIRQSVHGVIDGLENIRIAPEFEAELDENQVIHEMDYFYTRDDKPFSSCRCYRNDCIITWDGRMIGCNFVRSHSVNAMEGNFVENFRHLWDSLDTIKTPEKCLHCKYLRFCNPCPGALEGESGDPETISPYVCALARENFQRINLKRKPDIMKTNECGEDQ